LALSTGLLEAKEPRFPSQFLVARGLFLGRGPLRKKQSPGRWTKATVQKIHTIRYKILVDPRSTPYNPCIISVEPNGNREGTVKARLTEQQQDAVMRITTPLDPLQRQAFFKALSQFYRGQETIGDGELYRTLRELQRAHFLYPQINPHIPSHSAKTRRGYVK
jgi:hypothetical protein